MMVDSYEPWKPLSTKHDQWSSSRSKCCFQRTEWSTGWMSTASPNTRGWSSKVNPVMLRSTSSSSSLFDRLANWYINDNQLLTIKLGVQRIWERRVLRGRARTSRYKPCQSQGDAIRLHKVAEMVVVVVMVKLVMVEAVEMVIICLKTVASIDCQDKSTFGDSLYYRLKLKLKLIRHKNMNIWDKAPWGWI